jgi:adenylate cyclase
MEPLMEAPRLERKLVAILAADVEGYSRHMEQDEVATLATLSRHRLIVDELIARHSGRITGTAGDSVLAEFVSVVDALDCAVQISKRSRRRRPMSGPSAACCSGSDFTSAT